MGCSRGWSRRVKVKVDVDHLSDVRTEVSDSERRPLCIESWIEAPSKELLSAEKVNYLARAHAVCVCVDCCRNSYMNIGEEE